MAAIWFSLTFERVLILLSIYFLTVIQTQAKQTPPLVITAIDDFYTSDSLIHVYSIIPTSSSSYFQPFSIDASFSDLPDSGLHSNQNNIIVQLASPQNFFQVDPEWKNVLNIAAVKPQQGNSGTISTVVFPNGIMSGYGSDSTLFATIFGQFLQEDPSSLTWFRLQYSFYLRLIIPIDPYSHNNIITSSVTLNQWIFPTSSPQTQCATAPSPSCLTSETQSASLGHAIPYDFINAMKYPSYTVSKYDLNGPFIKFRVNSKQPTTSIISAFDSIDIFGNNWAYELDQIGNNGQVLCSFDDSTQQDESNGGVSSSIFPQNKESSSVHHDLQINQHSVHSSLYQSTSSSNTVNTIWNTSWRSVLAIWWSPTNASPSLSTESQQQLTAYSSSEQTTPVNNPSQSSNVAGNGGAGNGAVSNTIYVKHIITTYRGIKLILGSRTINDNDDSTATTAGITSPTLRCAGLEFIMKSAYLNSYHDALTIDFTAFINTMLSFRSLGVSRSLTNDNVTQRKNIFFQNNNTTTTTRYQGKLLSLFPSTQEIMHNPNISSNRSKTSEASPNPQNLSTRSPSPWSISATQHSPTIIATSIETAQLWKQSLATALSSSVAVSISNQSNRSIACAILQSSTSSLHISVAALSVICVVCLAGLLFGITAFIACVIARKRRHKNQTKIDQSSEISTSGQIHDDVVIAVTEPMVSTTITELTSNQTPITIDQQPHQVVNEDPLPTAIVEISHPEAYLDAIYSTASDLYHSSLHGGDSAATSVTDCLSHPSRDDDDDDSHATTSYMSNSRSDDETFLSPGANDSADFLHTQPHSIHHHRHISQNNHSSTRYYSPHASFNQKTVKSSNPSTTDHETPHLIPSTYISHTIACIDTEASIQRVQSTVYSRTSTVGTIYQPNDDSKSVTIDDRHHDTSSSQDRYIRVNSFSTLLLHLDNQSQQNAQQANLSTAAQTPAPISPMGDHPSQTSQTPPPAYNDIT